MAIITISRGSYFRGKEIAHKVAQKLGYACISRENLLKNAKGFNIPEIKLIRAFQDGPSILNRFTHGKERYIAYIQAALLSNLKKDNLVYHGFAFHGFVKEIPCTLKVRITAKLKDRIRYVMERDKLPKRDAERFIERSMSKEESGVNGSTGSIRRIQACMIWFSISDKSHLRMRLIPYVMLLGLNTIKRPLNLKSRYVI